ncbi:MAG: ammonium transporter [Spirochaetes bacterium]|nr:ammonium transporter [Spirochaetota bacterium]
MKRIPVVLGFALASACAVFAEGAAPAPVLNTGDTAWVLTASALVLLMTVPGLALFYGGLVRKKNLLSTIYYSLASAIIVSVLWVVVGYSLAFGTSHGGIIGGLNKAFFHGITKDSLTFTVPEFAFAMFQLMFAIITVGLVSGAVVERMKFSAWVLFIVLWSLIVYSPLAHWVWGGGWLSGGADGTSVIGKLFGVKGYSNALDFAGGLVVHASSGISALVAAIVLGPRVRYGKDPIVPNNIPYTFIGAGLLWFGWFGFNAGSALGANGLAAIAFLVTNTAAAMAGLTWLALEWVLHKKPTVVGASTGLVAGLVAITPASGFVDVTSALVIGFVVSVLCYIMIAFVKKAAGYDDALDAFGVHGVGGIWGALATGIFANPAIGFFFDGTTPAAGALFGNMKQVGIQAVSVGAALVWSIAGTLLILGIIKLVNGLRVSPAEELYGLDLTLHGEKTNGNS